MCCYLDREWKCQQSAESKSVFFRPQRLGTNKKTRLCCISHSGDMKDDPPASFASKGSVLSQVKQPLSIINICANVLYCPETTILLQSKSGPGSVHFFKSIACCKSAGYVVSVGVENSLSAPIFNPRIYALTNYCLFVVDFWVDGLLWKCTLIFLPVGWEVAVPDIQHCVGKNFVNDS